MSQEKTFATGELNIFARINFRECYEIKYFAVPNFCEFAKKIAKSRNFVSLKFLTLQ